MQDLLPALVWTGLHWLSPLVSLWLAYFFGRTLRPCATPLIERIARLDNAALSPSLCRYTRWLTVIWCGYFVGAATLFTIRALSAGKAFSHLGLGVLAGSVLLFVGEHWLRPRIFPNETFPGLLQQLRNTWKIWRASDTFHAGPSR